MPAKTPIYLKTPTSNRGKKLKLRDVLSGDMISPPLGDLRHSAHIGPEGERDMFGDLGFLQGNTDKFPALAHLPQPSPKNMTRHFDDMFDVNCKGLCSHLSSNHTSCLKTTISMPVYITHGQPPPKPPRLHLEVNYSPKQQQQQQNHHNQQQRSMSVCEEGVGHYREPCHDLTISASIPILRHLVPAAGSFSEASSDDSISDGCGPLDPKRGLSLDSDAGLSNEDLWSGHESSARSSTVSHSESFAGLDLDLGPSILEDVLKIMDRYKSERDKCEL